MLINARYGIHSSFYYNIKKENLKNFFSKKAKVRLDCLMDFYIWEN